jgi:DNA-binding FrmR family transcriptional regulator
MMTDSTTTIDNPALIRRLKSIEGHIRGIQKMVEDDAYCIDIVGQIQAVQAALHKVNSLVLDRHLHTCVTTAIQGDDPAERERVITEVLSVFNAKSK